MASRPNKGQGKGTFGRDAGGALGQESSTHCPPPPFALQPRAQLRLGGFPKVGGIFGCLFGSSALGVSEPEGPAWQLSSGECLCAEGGEDGGAQSDARLRHQGLRPPGPQEGGATVAGRPAGSPGCVDLARKSFLPGRKLEWGFQDVPSPAGPRHTPRHLATSRGSSERAREEKQSPMGVFCRAPLLFLPPSFALLVPWPACPPQTAPRLSRICSRSGLIVPQLGFPR